MTHLRLEESKILTELDLGHITSFLHPDFPFNNAFKQLFASTFSLFVIINNAIVSPAVCVTNSASKTVADLSAIFDDYEIETKMTLKSCH